MADTDNLQENIPEQTQETVTEHETHVVQNDVPEEKPNQEVNYQDTGLNNLKQIAENKGLDFDEFQKAYVANNCTLTEDMKQKCLDAGVPPDFIDRAVEGIKSRHDKEMNEVAEVVGGRENLTKALEWGKQNLSKEELEDFQTDLSSNPSLTTAQAIVFYIHNKMMNAEGKAPEYINNTTGGGALTDIFKSKAEALKAMSDPRYDCTHKDYDEAYVKELEAKLDRTKTANGGISLFG